MKHLVIKERFRRENFKETETQYIALKSIIHNQTLSKSFRWEASLLLSKNLKRQSCVTLKNRCFITGRSRGYSRFFCLSRIQIRDFARNNSLPHVIKSSW